MCSAAKAGGPGAARRPRGCVVRAAGGETGRDRRRRRVHGPPSSCGFARALAVLHAHRERVSAVAQPGVPHAALGARLGVALVERAHEVTPTYLSVYVNVASVTATVPL